MNERCQASASQVVLRLISCSSDRYIGFKWFVHILVVGPIAYLFVATIALSHI
jgi:hypothetical protein